jgi:hypothetical protein
MREVPDLRLQRAGDHGGNFPDWKVEVPDLWLAGPDGEQLSLPGALWPAGASMGGDGPIFFGKMAIEDANTLLRAWEHPLGPYERAYQGDAWGMAVDGQAVALAISSSTVSAPVLSEKDAERAGVSGKLVRSEVVELSRIARHPAHPGAMRAMLRLWRDYLGPRWACCKPRRGETPVAAVSYALPGKAGNCYRFDGWTKIGLRKPSGGGGTWSKRPKAADIADGRKTMWVYEYPGR